MLLISPVLWVYHALPLWVMGSLIGGIYLARLVDGRHGAVEATRVIQIFGLLLLLSSVIGVGVWRENGRVRAGDRQMKVEAISGARGEFGYIFGVWPELYFSNGIIPASSVLYPPIPGVQLKRDVVYGAPGSTMAKLLSEAQAHAASQLMRDFAATPPKHIVLVDPLQSLANPSLLTGFVVLDNYISEKCVFSRNIRTSFRRLMKTASLYECRVTR